MNARWRVAMGVTPKSTDKGILIEGRLVWIRLKRGLDAMPRTTYLL